MKPIFLVCGVPGSGKSWVCRQLTDKFRYIAHDSCWTHPSLTAKENDLDPEWPEGAKSNHLEVLIQESWQAEKPILTECPFAERELRKNLESVKIKVIPFFVIEDPDTVAERYLKREGKPLPKNVYTRATSILKRAEEWNAFYGSSNDVLRYLSRMGIHEG